MNYNPVQTKMEIGSHFFYADINDGIVKAGTWTEMPYQLRWMMYGNIFKKQDDAQNYLNDLDSHSLLDYANREDAE